MRNPVFFASLFILIAACSPPETRDSNEDLYFDVAEFVSQLALDEALYSKSYIKTVNIDNELETREISRTDSLFWQKELASLIGLDLNKPSLKGAFDVSVGLDDPASNLSVDKYQLNPEANSDIKYVEIAYLSTQDDVRRIIMREESVNALFTSSKTIELYLGLYSGHPQPDSVNINVGQWRLGADSTQISIRLQQLD